MEFSDFSIGVDIESIDRFEEYAKDRNSRLVARLFTEDEIEYCFSSKSPQKHIAARFCAKEAIYKALCGLGESGIRYKDIEIYHSPNKVPQVRFLSAKHSGYQSKISLSHSENKAVAYVIVTKK